MKVSVPQANFRFLLLAFQHQAKLASPILEAEAESNLLKFNKTLGRYPCRVTEEVSGLPILRCTPTRPTLNAPSRHLPSEITVQAPSTSHEYFWAMLGWLVGHCAHQEVCVAS